MIAHPILIERPIVVAPRGAKLCRPSEEVLAILDAPLAQDFRQGRRRDRRRTALTRQNVPRMLSEKIGPIRRLRVSMKSMGALLRRPA